MRLTHSDVFRCSMETLFDTHSEGGGAVFFMVTYQQHGREFHDKLATQQPHLNRELRGNYRRVARGEYALYLPFTLPDVLDLKELPVKAIVPALFAPFVNDNTVLALLKMIVPPFQTNPLMEFV